MKKLFCILLSAFMLTSTFTGCTQADATASAEVTETVAASITAASEAGNLADYEVPDRFTGSWTGLENSYFVTADAEILMPDTDRMVTASVKPRNFTQEEANAMMAVFLKGNTLYQEETATKEDYAERLTYYEAILQGEIPYSGDHSIDTVPDVIARIKRDMETAPNEGERFEADTSYHSSNSENEQVIEGYAEVDGRIIHCSFQNYNDPTAQIARVQARFWEEGYGDYNSRQNCSNEMFWTTVSEGAPVDPGFSAAQAQALVDDLLAELGMESFTLDFATPVTFGAENGDIWYHKAVHNPDGETGYHLMYVRNVGGLPLTWTKEDGSASEDNATVDGSWADEKVHLLVKEDRVVWFSWESPYTQPEILDSNVELVPFSDIQDVFAKMIFVKNHRYLEANKTVDYNILHDANVDKVQLSMMRTRPKDSVSEGTLIPVWDFWAETSAHPGENAPEGIVYNGRYYEVVLTINAITGTVVDREIGY